MIRYATALVAAVLVVAGAQAGEFNKVVKVGDAAPAFKDLPGVDGKKVGLADLKTDIVVVAITCNHCPVAVAYEDRIVELAKKYKGKVEVVAINVNTNDTDKLDKMVERSKAKGFNFAYLYDESQMIGKELGATVTPEFFVLNKERKIVYMGAMDDSQNPANVKQKYLEAAVDAALKGEKPAKAETKPFGCGVQYNKK